MVKSEECEISPEFRRVNLPSRSGYSTYGWIELI